MSVIAVVPGATLSMRFWKSSCGLCRRYCLVHGRESGMTTNHGAEKTHTGNPRLAVPSAASLTSVRFVATGPGLSRCSVLKVGLQKAFAGAARPTNQTSPTGIAPCLVCGERRG